MKVFIDQSGKIEETAKPTIIAFSNRKKASIKVSAHVKRQLQEIFRRRGAIRLFIYRTFASIIFLLLKPYIYEISDVVIDLEYPGHDKLIKDILLEHLRAQQFPEPTISFQRIGNRPPVHYAAYDVFIKEKKEDIKASLDMLRPLAIKKDRGLLRLKNT